jgi:integrase
MTLTNPDITLQSYASRWLLTYADNLKPATVKAYRESLTNHILPFLADVPLSGIKRRMAIDLIVELRRKGLSANSIRLVHATLRVILNGAVDEGILPVNPASKPGRLLRGPIPAGMIVTPLTQQELSLFLNTIKDRFTCYYPLFLTLARTGLRFGEALGLLWQDIDFEKRLIHVRRTLGMGGIEAPKNGKTRNVDMSQQLGAVLRRHLMLTREEVLKNSCSEFPPWVFCNTVGTPLDPNNVRERIFYKAIEASGLRKFRIHDLRHTYASLLIQNGESLAYVKDQLGHHSIQITVDTYGHLVCGANRQAVDRLDDQNW